MYECTSWGYNFHFCCPAVSALRSEAEIQSCTVLILWKALRLSQEAHSSLYEAMAGKKQVTLNGGASALNGSANGSANTHHPASDKATDLERWRLLDERGRQTWHYLESDEDLASWPQSIADRYFLDLPLASSMFPMHRTC